MKDRACPQTRVVDKLVPWTHHILVIIKLRITQFAVLRQSHITSVNNNNNTFHMYGAQQVSAAPSKYRGTRVKVIRLPQLWRGKKVRAYIYFGLLFGGGYGRDKRPCPSIGESTRYKTVRRFVTTCQSATDLQTSWWLAASKNNQTHKHCSRNIMDRHQIVVST